MAAAMSNNRNSNASLPEGFSVFQPALGEQLQFFPAVGTHELDELVNAYLPGDMSIQEKRLTISLNFFEHIQLTGQSFKFYAVCASSPTANSTTSTSPMQDSGYGSSFNVSPVVPTWDFSQVSPASTSQESASKKQSKQSPGSGVSSRHRTADFSHIPGMKIMTRDGRDVTNSASRGSKTKEQRDHAHLMRIIKACESCRKKKIRCDPSHKKRTVASQPQSQAQSSKSAKKVKAMVQEAQVSVPVPVQNASPFVFDATVNDASMVPAPSIGTQDPTSLLLSQSWEDFIEYPMDFNEDYDFLTDPEGFFTPQSSSSLTSPESTSPAKSTTPTSQQGLASDFFGTEGLDLANVSPQLPFNQPELGNNYQDFNLYSPQSSFSEDDRILSIEQSSNHALDNNLATTQRDGIPQSFTSESFIDLPYVSSDTDLGALSQPFRVLGNGVRLGDYDQSQFSDVQLGPTHYERPLAEPDYVDSSTNEVQLLRWADNERNVVIHDALDEGALSNAGHVLSTNQSVMQHVTRHSLETSSVTSSDGQPQIGSGADHSLRPRVPSDFVDVVLSDIGTGVLDCVRNRTDDDLPPIAEHRSSATPKGAIESRQPLSEARQILQVEENHASERVSDLVHEESAADPTLLVTSLHAPRLRNNALVRSSLSSQERVPKTNNLSTTAVAVMYVASAALFSVSFAGDLAYGVLCAIIAWSTRSQLDANSCSLKPVREWSDPCGKERRGGARRFEHQKNALSFFPAISSLGTYAIMV